MADPAAHIPDHLIHPSSKRPRADSSTAAPSSPNKSAAAAEKLLDPTAEVVMQVAAGRFIANCILLRQPKQQERTPTPHNPPSHSLPFPPLLISKAICREGRRPSEARAFCSRALLHEGEAVFCLRDNMVLPLRL